MVNSYMMMWQYCELKGVRQPYNHHQFHKKIGYALINPDKEWTTKGRERGRTLSPLHEKRKRATKMTKNALHPETGTLRIWLDMSHEHLPVCSPKVDYEDV